MKIVIDTSSLLAGPRRGGLANYLYHIIEGLQREDTQNDYVLFMPIGQKGTFPISEKNFHVHTLPGWTNNPIGNIIWSFLGLPWLLRRVKADVVHFPDYRRFMLWKPCRVVTTVHDLINLRVQGRLDRARRIYHSFNVPFVKRQADIFVTVSENTKKDMRHFGFRESSIRVIPNGASPDFRPRPREEARKALQKYGLPEKFVLCVSRLEHPQKNHVTLLRAWDAMIKKRTVDYKLVLVGEKWWNWEVVMREMAELGLEKDVLWVDYVPAADLPYFYNAADIFVFPSLYEGFGFPVIEAMASGAPVVASRASSIMEVAKEAALYFDPTNVNELCQRLEELLQSETQRDTLRRDGFITAQRYSWSRSSRDHVSAYREAGLVSRPV